jgi:hypothetical protein
MTSLCHIGKSAVKGMTFESIQRLRDRLTAKSPRISMAKILEI